MTLAAGEPLSSTVSVLPLIWANGDLSVLQLPAGDEPSLAAVFIIFKELLRVGRKGERRLSHVISTVC